MKKSPRFGLLDPPLGDFSGCSTGLHRVVVAGLAAELLDLLDPLDGAAIRRLSDQERREERVVTIAPVLVEGALYIGEMHAGTRAFASSLEQLVQTFVQRKSGDTSDCGVETALLFAFDVQPEAGTRSDCDDEDRTDDIWHGRYPWVNDKRRRGDFDHLAGAHLD